jgi:hypothetical protein
VEEEFILGTFKLGRETRNTYVYTRDNEGRKESQYVPKAILNGQKPETIEVVIRAR